MAKTATAKQLPLPSLIRASAWDAGNSSMEKAGRTKWSRADFNAAARFQNRVIANCFGEGPAGFIKFGIAEAMQRAGAICIGMKEKDFFSLIDATFETGAAS